MGQGRVRTEWYIIGGDEGNKEGRTVEDGGRQGKDWGRMRQGKLRGVNHGPSPFPFLPCLCLQEVIILCAQSLLCPAQAVTWEEAGMVRRALFPFIATGSGIQL